MYLFFDTETNAIGSMHKPVSQTLMQLAWVTTKCEGSIDSIHSRFVKGAWTVGPYAPHGITPEYVAEHGDEPEEVLSLFLKDCERVVASGGRLVAHNADFDVGVVEHALGRELDVSVKKGVFCTMKDSAIMKHFGLRNRRGGYKYPKLSEMYTGLFGEDPGEQLHDALGDSHVLRKCFHKLLELNVVAFASPPPREQRVGKNGCELFVNASDVATLSGMMTKYNQHPHTVAERVLSRFGSNIGVSGRACEVVPSETETQMESMLERASTSGGKCENATVLGKREREMHEEIDRREGLTPEVASEAKRLVSSRLGRAFGVVQEDRVVSQLSLEGNNAETFRLRCGTTSSGVSWGIVGKVDGFSEGRLVEVKSRKKYLFNTIRDYERVQLEIYMRMTNVSEATLVENLSGNRGTHIKEHRIERDDNLWGLVIKECSAFFEKLTGLVGHKGWEEGTDVERRLLWEKM